MDQVLSIRSNSSVHITYTLIQSLHLTALDVFYLENN